MKTVIVYDANNLDSIFAAAAIASIKQVTPCDSRSFLPVADNYVWIGVVPTKYYFGMLTEKEFRSVPEKRKHTAIVNIISTKGLKEFGIKNVDYLYSLTHENLELNNLEVNIVNSYGNRSLLERSLMFFGEDPEIFAPLSFMLKEFYNPLATQEIIEHTCLNAKEALESLIDQASFFVPTPYSEKTSSKAFEVYKAFDYQAKIVLKSRGFVNMIFSSTDGKISYVNTFHEQSLWWFIKRRIFNKNLILRNISVSSTGTIVTSSAPYLENIRSADPVFVY